MAQANHQPHSHLLTLPRELRDQIYEAYAYEEDGYIYDYATKRMRLKRPSGADEGGMIDQSLSLTCKMVAEETRGVAFRINEITFVSGLRKTRTKKTAFVVCTALWGVSDAIRNTRPYHTFYHKLDGCFGHDIFAPEKSKQDVSPIYMRDAYSCDHAASVRGMSVHRRASSKCMGIRPRTAKPMVVGYLLATLSFQYSWSTVEAVLDAVELTLKLLRSKDPRRLDILVARAFAEGPPMFGTKQNFIMWRHCFTPDSQEVMTTAELPMPWHILDRSWLASMEARFTHPLRDCQICHAEKIRPRSSWLPAGFNDDMDVHTDSKNVKWYFSAVRLL
ncbi:hypothetical protein BU23DRAFT_564260 [Bimuria novae-zelandiae CBS 107.79]|uniref:Uncharacterized protein n=1 Tax=Bimuria novae-zelandiae CBS 107.79 TaxID=1447943 RepID=A0A6A5VP49_9PLEO|nr:hypothetical protein BU23DRAFT_564260 [Bimuria novae-zelandiae CBS 107.79]